MHHIPVRPQHVEKLLRDMINRTLRGAVTEISFPHPCKRLVEEALINGVSYVVDLIFVHGQGSYSLNGEKLDLRWNYNRSKETLEMWIEGSDRENYPISIRKLDQILRDAGFLPIMDREAVLT